MDSLIEHEPVARSLDVIEKAFSEFNNLGSLFAGGKDSTLLLYLIRKVSEDFDVIFIDTGHHFDEVIDFRDTVAELWDLDIIVARYEGELNPSPRNPRLCCQTKKTLPLHETIAEQGYDGVFIGIRRDECEARAAEQYFSPRNYENFPGFRHMRIHPLLHWRLNDVWEYTKGNDLPVNPLYEEGYTSIGCEPCTEKGSGEERSGRRQDKEEIMEELRKWK